MLGINETSNPYRSNLDQQDAAQRKAIEEASKKAADAKAAEEAAKKQQMQNALSGPGGEMTFYGSPEQQQGQLAGLQMGQMLYGQGIADIGREAQDYSSMVKGRLSADAAQADVARQVGNERLAKQAAAFGLGGYGSFGAGEQAKRQQGMEAAAMNQDYKDKALALYGRNISAKQQGLASQYQAGAGIGQAQTPVPTANYSTTLGCLALVSVGLMSKETYASEAPFINSQSLEYIGYTMLVTPFIPLILKNGKFAKVFSFFAHKYVLNLTGEKKSLTGKAIKYIGGSICKMVGALC